MKRALIAVGIVAALGACTGSGSLTPEALANRELCEELKRELFQDPDIRSFLVYPSCEPGKITLNGSVRDYEGYEKAERIARSVPGVREVRNNLRILEEDPSDPAIFR